MDVLKKSVLMEPSLPGRSALDSNFGQRDTACPTTLEKCSDIPFRPSTYGREIDLKPAVWSLLALTGGAICGAANSVAGGVSRVDRCRLSVARAIQVVGRLLHLLSQLRHPRTAPSVFL
jgi:hypothetical protein